MLKPTIHINGTAPANLYVANIEALRKVKDAAEALEAAAPNGRDFYPQGPAAINEALRQHRARLALLQSVASELEAICEHIIDQRGT